MEWVNRNHDCPSCRKPLQATELYRNYSLETLICKRAFGLYRNLLVEKLIEEQEKAKQKYFEDLVVNAAVGKDNKATSPIETVFMLNMRESLLSYQEYYEQLMKEKEGMKNKIKTQIGNPLQEARQNAD